MPTTILLVDNQPIFRKGLRLIFDEEQDMSVVGEAADGQEAINRARELLPDVVVIDISVPNLNGIEATRHILAESPDTKVMALSNLDGQQFVQDMLSAGATGYILKDSVPEELPNGIRKMLQGEVYLSSAITEVVVSDYVNLLSNDQEMEKAPAGPHTALVESTTYIIRTKFHRPPVTAVHMHRHNLLDKLNNRLYRPLTLVCAPAGYGKSTLVSCWLDACDLPTAWLSLDETDNDLHLFLEYFLAAVQTVFPEAGQGIRAILHAAELPPLPHLTGILINDLDKIDQNFILTMDDFHVVENKAIHELLDGVLKHPPHAMHLVLASRIDPSLSLTALRAKGQMTEIRARDLRFSRKEIAEFLQQMLEKTIEESSVVLLEEKTEGWITGLHLVAQTLRHTDGIERTIASLPDANQYILDYFVEEVLSKQPVPMQDYLISTSVLDRFCAPLCDAVCTSNTDSGSCEVSGYQFFQPLKKANLFVIRLDDEGRWFRYHHLFKSLLKIRLNQHFEQEVINLIHTKASTWFAENGHIEEAVQHALAGDEVERAAEIVGRARHDLMNRDQWRRLERWLNLFSHKSVQQQPHLILLRCWLDLYHWYRLDYLVNDLDQADLLLEASVLTANEEVSLKAEVAAMRSHLAYWTLNPTQGVALAKQALRNSPKGHECVQSTALLGCGALYQMLGEAERGVRVLWDYMDDGRFDCQNTFARLMFCMCIVYWPEANSRKLLQAATEMRDIGLKFEQPWALSNAHYFLGLFHYERNELTDAVAQFEIIVGDPYRFPIQNVSHCSFLLSLSYQGLGLPDKARKIAESIAKLTFERGNKMFIDLTEAFQVDLDLRQGHIANADQWARAFVAPAPHAMHRFYNAELTSIRVLMAGKTPQHLKSATEQLDSMYELLTRIHHRRLMIDVLGMKALLADAQNQESTAFEKLSEALTLAKPGQIKRTFLDLGYPMADLLKRLAKQKPDSKYIEQILSAFSNEETGKGQNVPDDQSVHRSNLSNQAQIEPLTNREIEILTILSERLSNHEIAEKLFIADETVKKHLYNIYQKLDVKNRQQAIARAKSLGIL